ncbi:MAG: hypothetical protein M2R45_00082 [Verrucomicrobia subdivision 3 bacterium]|nr:hypothetical protein [Limisphaerales bacterium]MCS1412460.1 hypothetical protein [Limisphaerales bacterium]
MIFWRLFGRKDRQLGQNCFEPAGKRADLKRALATRLEGLKESIKNYGQALELEGKVGSVLDKDIALFTQEGVQTIMNTVALDWENKKLLLKKGD